MYAAVIREYGTPHFDVFDEPEPIDGAMVVNVTAAALSRFDVLHASGAHVLKPNKLPAVVGNEGVGRLADGRRVYFAGPVAPYGAMAERTLAAAATLIDVPDGVDDAVAVALGNSGLAAWLPLAWRAQLVAGERVLVIGASGIVGRLAVQAAKALGAARVVAAGRDAAALARARELGADAVVRLADDVDFASAYREASGDGVDVIVDYVWGPALEAAFSVARPGARVVQVGRAATGDVRLSADLMRAKSLSVLGYATYHAPSEVRARAYRHLVELAVRGQLSVDLERMPLKDIEQAWMRQRQGPRNRLVLLP